MTIVKRLAPFCVLFYFSTTFLVFAQNNPSNYKEMDTVIVSAKRVASNKSQIAENVIVYTQEDIKKLPARDLSEVLSYIPSVDVQLGGQFGQSTSLSINGSVARQVLLMVDGIPFNTQLSGQANPTQIPLEHIEQIEIIKGASSSVWGSSLGGVINVITKDVGTSVVPEGTLTTSVAEFDTVKESLNLAGKVKNLGYFVSGSHLTTEGAQLLSEVEEKKFFSKLSYALTDEAKLISSFGYNEADVQYALNTSSTFSSQPYNTRYGQMVLDVQQDNYQWSAAFKFNDQKSATDTVTIATGNNTSSTINRNIYKGISLNGSVDLEDYGLIVAGADFDWHTLKSSNFLDTGKRIKMYAPYINHTIAWKNFEFITGLRYDNNDRFGSQTSPSFGTVYHFNDDRETLIRAKVSRGFNAPPLLWLFQEGVTPLGPFININILPNPDLKAEKSVVYELGLETKPLPKMSLELNLYRADVEDAIKTVFTGLNSVQENFEKFRRQGVELIVNYDLTDDLTVYGSGAYNENENRTTRLDVRSQGISKHKFTFGAYYKNDDGWGIHLSGYYTRWASALSVNPNDRKPIFDLKLTKEFRDIAKDIDLELFLNIYNLSDSKYWSSASFPLPRRYVEGGVSFKF